MSLIYIKKSSLTFDITIKLVYASLSKITTCEYLIEEEKKGRMTHSNIL